MESCPGGRVFHFEWRGERSRVKWEEEEEIWRGRGERLHTKPAALSQGRPERLRLRCQWNEPLVSPTPSGPRRLSPSVSNYPNLSLSLPPSLSLSLHLSHHSNKAIPSSKLLKSRMRDYVLSCTIKEKSTLSLSAKSQRFPRQPHSLGMTTTHSCSPWLPGAEVP